jgi:hypothetical protein
MLDDELPDDSSDPDDPGGSQDGVDVEDALDVELPGGGENRLLDDELLVSGVLLELVGVVWLDDVPPESLLPEDGPPLDAELLVGPLPELPDDGSLVRPDEPLDEKLPLDPELLPDMSLPELLLNDPSLELDIPVP